MTHCMMVFAIFLKVFDSFLSLMSFEFLEVNAFLV